MFPFEYLAFLIPIRSYLSALDEIDEGRRKFK